MAGSEITESKVFKTNAVMVVGSLRAGIMEKRALRGSIMWLGRWKVFCHPFMLNVMGPDHSRLILGWGHSKASMALILGVNPL